MSLTQDVLQLTAFLKEAEKLKSTFRHSWVGDPPKQESSAEHTWMLCLIAVTAFHYLETPVDQLHVLKMLIVHDLAEAVTGDIPYFEVSARQEGKQEAERAALHYLLAKLKPAVQKEVLALWEEFEALTTAEAKIARTIDKYEALFSHSNAKIETWDEGDYRVVFGKDDELFAFDPFLHEMKLHITRVKYKKMQAAGTLEKVDPAYLKRYFPEGLEN